MTETNELYDKKIRCPLCDRTFITKRVRISKLRLIKRDEDFLPYYKGENPLKYNIYVCPHCGYAASENRYDSLTVSDKEIIIKEITSKWHKRDYGNLRTVDDAILTYKLALYIGQLLNYKKVELGSICLSIAWLNRIKGDVDEENRFLKLTKNLFEEGFYNESLAGTNMDELKLGYLIGEINRRLVEKEEALKWFNTILSNPNLKSNPMLEDMTREQWRLIREK